MKKSDINLANKLLQFMKETNHLNVTIVITALLKRVTLMHMLHPFMKEKSLSNAIFVITAVLIRAT